MQVGKVTRQDKTSGGGEGGGGGGAGDCTVLYDCNRRFPIRNKKWCQDLCFPSLHVKVDVKAESASLPL